MEIKITGKIIVMMMTNEGKMKLQKTRDTTKL